MPHDQPVGVEAHGRLHPLGAQEVPQGLVHLPAVTAAAGLDSVRGGARGLHGTGAWPRSRGSPSGQRGLTSPEGPYCVPSHLRNLGVVINFH